MVNWYFNDDTIPCETVLEIYHSVFARHFQEKVNLQGAMPPLLALALFEDSLPVRNLQTNL